MTTSENKTNSAIIPAQVQAARRLLAWSKGELAAVSGVPRKTIDRLELTEGGPQQRTLAAIRAALEAAGVEFIRENGGGPGLRLAKNVGNPIGEATVPLELIRR